MVRIGQLVAAAAKIALGLLLLTSPVPSVGGEKTKIGISTPSTRASTTLPTATATSPPFTMTNRDTVTVTAVSLGALAGATLLHVYHSYKSKKIERAPGGKPWRMSKWVKHNGVLRTQGLVGDFDKIKSSSTAQQTAQALAKLDDILEEAGITRSHLLSVRIYLADLSDDNFKAMNDVYDKWVSQDGLPVRICVQAYLGEHFEIELQAEAYY